MLRSFGTDTSGIRKRLVLCLFCHTYIHNLHFLSRFEISVGVFPILSIFPLFTFLNPSYKTHTEITKKTTNGELSFSRKDLDKSAQHDIPKDPSDGFQSHSLLQGDFERYTSRRKTPLFLCSTCAFILQCGILTCRPSKQTSRFRVRWSVLFRIHGIF